MNYWREALESSLDEHCPGIALSSEQAEAIAKDLSIAHEQYGMAFHHPEMPILQEMKDLKAKYIKEREKVGCSVCRGRGSITEYFGPLGRSSTDRCHKCNGEGKHAP
jgi:hypothetical protein